MAVWSHRAPLVAPSTYGLLPSRYFPEKAYISDKVVARHNVDWIREAGTQGHRDTGTQERQFLASEVRIVVVCIATQLISYAREQ